MSFIDSHHPRLQYLHSFSAYVRIPFSLIPTAYTYRYSLCSSASSKCKDIWKWEVPLTQFPSLYTQTPINGRNLTTLFHQFSKHSPICVTLQFLLLGEGKSEIPALHRFRQKWNLLALWWRSTAPWLFRGNSSSWQGSMSRCLLPVLLFLRSD